MQNFLESRRIFFSAENVSSSAQEAQNSPEYNPGKQAAEVKECSANISKSIHQTEKFCQVAGLENPEGVESLARKNDNIAKAVFFHSGIMKKLLAENSNVRPYSLSTLA